MRRARDGMAYSHAEFLDWYMSRDPEDIHYWLHLAFARWQEAAPLNPAGDRFAAMVRQVGQVGASASHQIGCALASLARGSSEDVLQVVEDQAQTDTVEAEEFIDAPASPTPQASNSFSLR